MLFKKAIWIIACFLLIFLDLAALHDILVGESRPWQEWTMLLVSLPAWYGLLTHLPWRRIKESQAGA